MIFVASSSAALTFKTSSTRVEFHSVNVVLVQSKENYHQEKGKDELSGLSLKQIRGEQGRRTGWDFRNVFSVTLLGQMSQ